MFGLGPTEMIIILIIVLVLFGGKKLPQIGDGMGRAIRNFKNAVTAEEKPDFEQAIPEITDHSPTEEKAPPVV